MIEMLEALRSRTASRSPIGQAMLAVRRSKVLELDGDWFNDIPPFAQHLTWWLQEVAMMWWVKK